MPTVSVTEETMDWIEEIQDRGYSVSVKGDDGEVVEQYRETPSKAQVVRRGVASQYEGLFGDDPRRDDE